ncbi:AbiH family protein [Pseudoflavonifractor phocaeensis]|uniref:AbiH family protein n=1 Tax=Pseudoflavonifractor phocaeensis TaxID=1870988 RepID=UPI00195DD31E|nr:AbiH family protein [Pseudoflavonifractor phocaeensis]MBM6723549.1 hypothetical protein [Pseudoflavonifractor phocaeensis]
MDDQQVSNVQQTLYVLGNGFDLAHKLPTRYSDFLLFLNVLAKYPKHASSNTARDKFNGDKDFTDLDSRLKEYLKKNWFTDQVSGPLKEIQTQLKDPWVEGWFSYFKRNYLPKDVNKGWIDFEKEIQHLVTSFVVTSLENPGHCIIKDLSFPDLFCKTDLKFYRVENDPLGQQYIIEPYEFFSSLYSGLKGFTYSFELYLSIINNLYFSGSGFINTNSYFYKLASNDPPDYILSFNYMETFEKSYNHPAFGNISKIAIHHIHGKVRENPDSKEGCNLVLGFNDIQENALSAPNSICPPTIWFEKIFQRILNRTGTEIYHWLEQLNTKDHPLHTIFYGHSLDITDRDVLLKIFNCSSHITIHYHSDEVYPQLIMNLIALLGKNCMEDMYNAQIIEFKKISS